jgi:tyrosinase
MLARYDIERLGMNLPLIKPIEDYSAPIDEGYKPNENLVDTNDDYSTFGFREPHSKLRDVGL